MDQSVKPLTSALVCGFESYVEVCADSSEPGACFGFCVWLSAPPPLTLCFSLSLSKKERNIKKFFLQWQTQL